MRYWEGSINEGQRNHDQPWPNRLLPIALAAVLVFGACVSSETSVDDPESPPGEEAAVEDNAFDDDGSFAPIDSVTLRTLQLPEGVRAFVAEDQSIGFGNASYLVTLRADGVRLVVVESDGARDTDAFIAGARFGEVFHSGSRIVMTGSDEAGDLVVLSSDDGVTFTEARIVIPDRYVDADVWAATTLVADVADVADLDGDLFVIARVGINWRRASGVVADFAYTISEELGDAATSSGTVSAAPQGDGDTLYTFKADGEVVFESLGSEAGVEPGYEDAYDDTFSEDSDLGFHGGWVVSGTTAAKTEVPPLDGELDQDIRLLELYSVGEGVAALVWDFSVEAAGAQYYMSGGAGSFGALVVGRYYSEWRYGVHHWWGSDGEWEVAIDSLGDPTAGRPEILKGDASDVWWAAQEVADGLNIAQSHDGLVFSEFDRHEWDDLPEGDSVFALYAYRYRANNPVRPDDGIDIDIDVEIGEPLEYDPEPEPAPFDDPVSPETTDSVKSAEIVYDGIEAIFVHIFDGFGN